MSLHTLTQGAVAVVEWWQWWGWCRGAARPCNPLQPAHLDHTDPTYCRFFKDRNIDVKVEYSWGATEVKVRHRLCVCSLGRPAIVPLACWMEGGATSTLHLYLLCPLPGLPASPLPLSPQPCRIPPRQASLPGVGGIVDITETGSSLKANKLRVRLACGQLAEQLCVRAAV